MVFKLAVMYTRVKNDVDAIDNTMSSHRHRRTKSLHSQARNSRKPLRKLQSVKDRRPLSTLFDDIASSVKLGHEDKQGRLASSPSSGLAGKEDPELTSRSSLCSEVMLLFDLFGIDMYHRARLDNINIASEVPDDFTGACLNRPTFPSHRKIISNFEKRLLKMINRATRPHATDILASVTLRICELARYWDGHIDNMLQTGRAILKSHASSSCVQVKMSTQADDWVLLYPWSDILHALTSSKAASADTISKISGYMNCRAQQLRKLACDLEHHEAQDTSAIDLPVHSVEGLATSLFETANSLSKATPKTTE